MIIPFVGCNHALRVFTRGALAKRGSGGNFAVSSRDQDVTTSSSVWKFCCVGGAIILQ